MPTPIRLLRAQADDLPGARPRPSQKDTETQNRILAAATSLMASFGRTDLTMAAFAAAIRLSPATIRRHYPDLDTILHEILTRHLHAIAVAFGEIPFTTPNRPAARRALYARQTRNCLNAPTEAHLLLLRERHTLPPDLAASIETLRILIGDMLCPAHPEIALALLDTPELQPPQVEAMLAALDAASSSPAHPEVPAPEPAAKPQADAPPARLTIVTPARESQPTNKAPAHPPPQGHAGNRKHAQQAIVSNALWHCTSPPVGAELAPSG